MTTQSDKVSKKSVRYRPGRGKRVCGNCGMFQILFGCDLVKGFIWPFDTCDRWVKRSAVQEKR